MSSNIYIFYLSFRWKWWRCTESNRGPENTLAGLNPSRNPNHPHL